MIFVVENKKFNKSYAWGFILCGIALYIIQEEIKQTNKEYKILESRLKILENGVDHV